MRQLALHHKPRVGVAHGGEVRCQSGLHFHVALLHADVKSCVVAEIDNDLTKHSVWDIEKHLAG